MSALSVSEAVRRRISVRAFLPTGIPDKVIAEVLAAACRAPSGGNLQPWRVYVLNGPCMERFRTLMEAKLAESPLGEPTEYDVYPKDLKEPYRSQRHQVAEDMYALLGIPRTDKFARLLWVANNFRCFGAPAAAFCFIDRSMGPPQWSDLGMYLQTAMLLFQERGIDTCPQEAWSRWPQTVGTFVGAPPDLMLFCGLAIGHADPDAAVNRLRSARATDIVTFVA